MNAKNSKRSPQIYFMGIGGTGMAAVAGLAKEAGYGVTGSDKGVYPPMSEMLAQQKISYKTPYSAQNLTGIRPDLVVVGNALSRGNEELEAMLVQGVPFTSFPAFLGEHILSERCSVVIAGTHGKTTTTSIAAYVLSKLREDPGYMIGGVPRDLKTGFHLGKGEVFVIEGDEYDTAYFDKGPKFLHYRPQFVILNNIEFDHADIYKNVEQIEAQFESLLKLVKDPRHIIANMTDPGVSRVVQRLGLAGKVSAVITSNSQSDFEKPSTRLIEASPTLKSKKEQTWQAKIHSDFFGEFEITTHLDGLHNIANICQVITLLARLAQAGHLLNPISLKKIVNAIASFQGVKRRLDHIANVRNIDIYEDFAHHPTAIKLVIDSFRRSHPKIKRLIIAFEPANATGRRNVLLNQFAEALSIADVVRIGKCPVDLRIPEAERMNTEELCAKIGRKKAKSYLENDDLLTDLKKELAAGDAVIFMSSSSFSGIQHRLAKELKSK